MSVGAWNKGPNDEGQTMHTWHFGLLETRSNMRNEVKDGTDQRQDWSLTKSGAWPSQAGARKDLVGLPRLELGVLLLWQWRLHRDYIVSALNHARGRIFVLGTIAALNHAGGLPKVRLIFKKTPNPWFKKIIKRKENPGQKEKSPAHGRASRGHALFTRASTQRLSLFFLIN